MKLITIEDPPKTILEPVSEAMESPTQISLEEEPRKVVPAGGIPSVSISPPTRKSRTVTEPPSQAQLAAPANQHQPLEKKKSDDGKVKRIRTKSRVETAL